MADQTSFSVFLTLLMFFLSLITNAKSKSFSFHLANFKNASGLGFLGDARISNGVLELTKKDKYGDPLPHSVGLAGCFGPVRIYDKRRSKFANFTTDFTFEVNRKGSTLHGDGMTFFIASPDLKFPDTRESSGGYLGLFNPKTAFDKSKNRLVAIEFDSFTNTWDPRPQYPFTQSPHIGIDVKSPKSDATVEWQSDSVPDGTIGYASISYEFQARKLNVLVTYPELGVPYTGASILQHTIDLTTVLPERVTIGFSAATGDLVETHDILSWSFNSNF